MHFYFLTSLYVSTYCEFQSKIIYVLRNKYLLAIPCGPDTLDGLFKLYIYLQNQVLTVVYIIRKEYCKHKYC